MFGRSLTLFELLGFKVKIDASWIFLALLITWSLARGYFPSVYEGLSPATYWWMGVTGLIGLMFSLVLHELSHSLVARRYGMPIRGITLFIFGGVAEMEDEPPSAKAEFLMAIAGPIMSFGLALAFYGVSLAGEAQGLPDPVLGVTRYLAFLNALLAAFNLLPAFPLDGGRVLRSGLWHWKRDLRWATRVASRIGAALGIVLMGLGVASVLTGDFIGGMWRFLIGLFLHGAARASYFQLMMRRALEGEPVRRFMSAKPVTVPPATTVRELVEEFIYRHHHDMFPVTGEGKLIGCVSTREVKAVPRERWDRLTVQEIAKPCSPENTIDANQDAVKALALMQRTGKGRLMVTQQGRLVGILALKDLLHFLSLKIDLEGVH
jgi:Zn-dependent protease/predicted transcriptional regulator